MGKLVFSEEHVWLFRFIILQSPRADMTKQDSKKARPYS